MRLRQQQTNAGLFLYKRISERKIRQHSWQVKLLMILLMKHIFNLFPPLIEFVMYAAVFKFLKIETMKEEVIRSICLVDDDDDDRMIFAEVLSEIYPSIDLQLVESGADLSQKLYVENNSPDIIFLNVNMPMKNGFDCLKEIRERPDNLKFLKIIMFSTSKNPDTIQLSMQLGADFYAVKPVSVNDLKNLITKIIMDWEVLRHNKVFLLN
ncbi:response regulator [Flavobacterium endoglycinae]|uniref:Response regulator n=3 Tax=Flavobacterium TaxID=237 RepID=A0ABX7QBH8_9FLAO|nr:response regulator [Flavobacterium endoglycinae]QSW88400.1 response regulator [Flavobacterium endoglycinae]